MARLQDKIALITGSSRGIGAAIAGLFAREGAKVAVHGRDAAALSAVLADIGRAGGCACQVMGDATKFGDIEAMRRDVEREFGPIDILVANAGGSFTKPGPIEETTEKAWRASIDGNLTATFLTIKSVLPGMKERRAGNIITVSSAAARRPSHASPIPYAAAKAGIQILTQDLAAQVGPYGNPGELHRSRDNSHRTQQAANTRSSAESSSRVASSKTPRHSRGRGIRSSLSCVR